MIYQSSKPKQQKKPTWIEIFDFSNLIYLVKTWHWNSTSCEMERYSILPLAHELKVRNRSNIENWITKNAKY